MRKKILKLAMILSMVLLSASPVSVFAMVSGPEADGAQGVLSSGDIGTFAKYAPISTIQIDFSKNTGIELDQSAPHSNNPNGYYLEDGYVKSNGVKMKESFSSLSGFTLIYKDAAILSTGETRNVEVVFGSGQIPQVVGKTGNGSYTDNLTFMKAYSTVNNGPAITPLSDARKHFGLRANIKVRVGKDGDFLDDTFLFTAFDININRTTNSNFNNIVYARANDSYSEAVEPSSGLDSESDFYIPGTYMEYEEDRDNDSTSPSPTYGIRFRGKNGNISASQRNYNSGFAAVGSSNGFTARYWSSAGSNDSPIELYLMPNRISHTSKSSSGDNGKIELWTSGEIDDENARLLNGGTVDAPRTYVVPNAKVVTYKMTPDSGYELDALMINGAEVSAVEVLDENGDVLYYTYTFDETISVEQEISVMWKKVPVLPTPVPEPDSPVLAPDSGANTMASDELVNISGVLIIAQALVVVVIVLVVFAKKDLSKK